jgi:glycosyltransferase involved in cell wall biosynthesis
MTMDPAAAPPLPVTVVIAARNEGSGIAECVRSVSWAAEVLVVENDSTDDTVARAREAGAHVFTHPFRTIGAQRNAAIARAAHEWIFVLDADERATTALGAELARRMRSPGSVEAWRVPRRNYFLGREIRHGGWERDRPVRFFRKSLRYDERPVHEHVITSGAVGVLDAAILHEPYESLAEYFEKLLRYSRDWAEQQYARGRRASMASLIVKPPARLFSMYVLRGGWRDGAQGAVLAALASMSVAAKYAMLWERGLRSAAVPNEGT